MSESWLEQQASLLPDDLSLLKAAYYLACDMVGLNMGGSTQEYMEHFLKMAKDWREESSK